MRALYIMLCGLPGSGKTTLATSLLPHFSGAILISSDRFIDEQATRRNSTYDEVFRESIDEATRLMNEARKEALSKRMTIVHDQTNLTANSRAKKLSSVSRQYLRIAVVCEVPDSVRWARMSERVGKTIGADLDASMKAGWQTPTLAEGFDAVMTEEVARALVCATP